MDIRLVIIGGKVNRSQVAVTLPTVIGRSREADLTIAHPMISRKHCELTEVNGLVMVRDLGSLNGLFAGGRQVNEAALHPNAQFTVGPLTFRVEYQYAGDVPIEPDATTITESHEPRQPAAGPEADDMAVVEPLEPDPPRQGVAQPPQVPAAQAEPADVEEQPEPAEIAGTIAPPDGELPDFSAWGVQDTEPEPPPGPLPPPPTFFTDGPPPADAAPEIRQDEVPEEATFAAPAPTVSLPETAAFEPGELAELVKNDHPASDVAEGDPPPEAPGEQPAEADAPPTQQSAGPADEETAESAVSPPPADEPPAEGMFDLALPPAPEPDQRRKVDTGDEELDDFLEGLQ